MLGLIKNYEVIGDDGKTKDRGQLTPSEIHIQIKPP